MASFFEKIILAEDKVYQYNKFWLVWEAFYLKIIEIGKENFKNHYSKDIIRKYLLAIYFWKEDAKDWRSLKSKEKLFFKRVVNDIGHNPVVFDSIAQFLNEIGQMFLNEGVFWIADLVEKNIDNELENNTVYYTELLTRKYIFQNRIKIKQELKIKNKILIILNFLIAKGSVGAYLMREDVL